MTELPPPLTPAGCDLRGMWMPLNITALKGSRTWLRCRREPALAFYLINLWTSAWFEIPAGSLPDDPDYLSDLAQCPRRTWTRLKDELLSGWIRCNDGRLYHPFVANEAVKSWEIKRSHRARTEAATAARKAKFTNVTSNVTSDVTTNVTLWSRSPKEDKEDKDSILYSPDFATATEPNTDAQFETWWKSYPGRIGADGKPGKTGKAACRKLWRLTLRVVSYETLIDATNAYATRTDPKFVLDPERWLKREKWTDEVATKAAPQAPWADGF